MNSLTTLKNDQWLNFKKYFNTILMLIYGHVVKYTGVRLRGTSVYSKQLFTVSLTQTLVSFEL